MKSGSTNKPRHARALALVAVMWVVVILSVIVTLIARTARLDTRISLAVAEGLRCKWSCRAGLETAIAVLNDDLKDSDCLTDTWSDNPEDFNDIELDRCSYTVNIIDEAGKLNINTATKAQLMQLPDMTEQIADSILDWRDNDDTLREYGAETGYYLNLAHPYPARNGNFRTIRELLLVKDVTGQLLCEAYPTSVSHTGYNDGWIHYLTCYSYDKNTDPQDNQRININNADENKLVQELGISQSQAKWIVENKKDGYKSIADLISEQSPQKPSTDGASPEQPQPLDLQTFYQIIDRITITNEKVIPGRININTASLTVLIALFEGNIQLAQDTIDYRIDLAYGLTSLGDLQNIKSLDIATMKKVIDLVTTRSSVFIITSTTRAHTTNRTQTAEAVVDRDKSPVQILYYRSGAQS